MSHIFVSYCREDETKVIRLCSELKKHGSNIWLDRDSIAPGENWKDAIRNAISSGSYFLACFSKAYEEKNKSYMNEELVLAIEELRQRSRKAAWFIPVLLDECSVPDRSIGAGETLRDLQWIPISKSWRDGIQKILATTSCHEINRQIELIDEYAHKYVTRSATCAPLPTKYRTILESLGLDDGASYRDSALELYLGIVEDLQSRFGILYDPLKKVAHE